VPSGLKRFVLWPDVHVPFEDKKAVRVALNAIDSFQPDTFGLMGDFADFWALSQHRKSPWRKQDVDWEIGQVSELLTKLESFKFKRKFYISGNHEWRYDRWIADEGSAFIKSMPKGAVSVQSYPELLELKKRKWEWIDYMDSTTIGKLHLTHDTGKAGANAHLAAERDFRHNAAIGHTHRFAYSVLGSIHKETQLGCMFGWLGDYNSIDYKHKATALREWVHGFAYGYVAADGSVYLNPVPLVNYTAVVEGKLIRA
jgi:hypothetical protein